MPFPGILCGFETHQKQFFEIFEAKEQKEKTVKSRKISGKNRTKEISVEISYRSPPIFDISTIFRPKYRKFCSLGLVLDHEVLRKFWTKCPELDEKKKDEENNFVRFYNL